MFRLDYLTPPGWVARVERDPLALLSDHAHCELKAAASAQALIAKNTDRTELVLALAGVAVEEMQHFHAVVRELHRRGGRLARQTVNPYAEALIAASATDRGDVLLDRLLVAGLIEARSLERFHLLAKHLADRSLGELYGSLIPSEASHQALFLDLARRLFTRPVADAREALLRAREGDVVRRLPFGSTVHSGMGDSAADLYDGAAPDTGAARR